MRSGQCDQSLIDGRRLLTPRVIGVRLPAQNTVHDNPRVRELLAEALHKCQDSVVVFPSFGNGVADDDSIDVSLTQPEVDAFLPLHPPFLVAARCGLSCCMRRPGMRCVWQACAPGDQAPERRGCRCFDGRGQELPTI